MIKGMRKNQRRRKGVLTVEAAIILPIFIMVMVFILSMLKLFYFHLVMQQALQNVGLTLAQYGYVIERTVGMESFALQEETTEKEAEIKNGVATLVEDGKVLFNTLDELGLSNLPEAIESGTKFGEDAGKLVDTIRSVDKKTIVNYLLVSAITEGGGNFVKWMIGDYFEAMEAGGENNPKIGYELYVETGSKDILLVVEYEYEFPVLFTESLQFQQMVRVHPWVGGKTEGAYKGYFQ